MATFRDADADAHAIIHDLVQRYYPDLKDAGVTIGCLFAFAPRNENTGEPTGPALKFANFPAAAIVKINSQQDRVEGKPDATIRVDGDQWPDWSRERQEALLDHEIYHIETRRDEEGQFLLDDCCRPKLKLRPHDFQLGGFVTIVERHGSAAIEAEATDDAWHRVHQGLLFNLKKLGEEIAAGEAMPLPSGVETVSISGSDRDFINRVGDAFIDAGVPLVDGDGKPVKRSKAKEEAATT